MDTLYDAPSWAHSEFGHAAVPDARNVARLVQMATRVAERPHAKVSAVFDSPAELEAAYDFLENDRVDPEVLVASSLRATAQRARDLPRVLVAVDGVSLTLRDPHDTRGTGSVGDRAFPARGLLAIDAVALTDDGVPLGLAAMRCWARSLQRVTRSHHQRAVADKETRHWIEARAAIREGFGREAPDTQLVLLHDAATDAWPVLVEAMAQDAHAREITVLRAAHNRRASVEPGSPSHLWSLLRRAPGRWTIGVRIPPRDGHPARRAKTGDPRSPGHAGPAPQAGERAAAGEAVGGVGARGGSAAGGGEAAGVGAAHRLAAGDAGGGAHGDPLVHLEVAGGGPSQNLEGLGQ